MSEVLVNRVSKQYLLGEIPVIALSDVSLQFQTSKLNALVGPSGSGKSTLLNLIGALDIPDQGEIIVGQTNVVSLSKDQRADFRNQECGFIFQNFNLVPILTALENVVLPAQLSRSRHGDAVDQGIHLLNQVGLGEQVHQPVNRLSGGQMQRVAIARSLINRPKVILADEPTANLDFATSQAILELLVDTAKKEGVAIIIATHDQQVIPYCSSVATLRDGRVVKDS